MRWTSDRLLRVIDSLRERGGDHTEIEAKQAAGGTPSLAETLCAFANLPNGGTILLGIDEGADFAVRGIAHLADAESAIASQARNAVTPAVSVAFETVDVDGKTVLVVTVAGLAPADRPCRTVTGGRAYLRQGDGDYLMSEQEVAQVLALRDRPRHDIAPVPGSSIADLSPELMATFLSEARATSRRLAAATDAQILRYKGVVDEATSTLTVAGLYALGIYPQAFAPALSITAAVEPADREVGRTIDLVHLDGPLPDLLDDAMAWVLRNVPSTIRYSPDGHAHDERTIPMAAVRELIANALVHRDLGPHTRGRRVEIRIRNGHLYISSPGGLWGVSTDQLGQPNGKSAVNEFLYEIGKLTRDGKRHRIIEGEGGGLREVRAALAQAQLPAPEFHDSAVRLTVVVSLIPTLPVAPRRSARPELLTAPTTATPPRGPRQISANAEPILDALAAAPAAALTRADISRATGLSTTQVGYALTKLIDAGRIQMLGGPGRPTRYRPTR